LIENNLVPTHELLNLEEAEKVLKKYGVTRIELPKIMMNDPAIAHLKVSVGDIIMILRNNPETGKSYYYRVVIEG